MSLQGWMGALLAILALAPGAAGAQQAQSPAVPAPSPATQEAAWLPRTGDAWVDRVLGDINDYGRRYPDAFVDELVRYHGAPRDYVETLLGAGGWAPADAWYACALAQVLGRSCRYVAEERQAHPGDGWGAIAQRLGVEPGSVQAQALEDGFAPAYARWARPLPAAVAKPTTATTKPARSRRK